MAAILLTVDRDTPGKSLALRFEKLKTARAHRDLNGIKPAEMAYSQSLQHLYAAAQDAASEQM